MSLIDQQFEEALRELPQKKLSWKADYRLRSLLKKRARELDGVLPWYRSFSRLIAVPVAAVFLLTVTNVYAFYSPSVVQGDLLYTVKTKGEELLYPESGNSEERIRYHLWLSDRRYSEVTEILQRKTGKEIVFIPSVFAADLNALDPLDALLFETLRRATKNVEMAFLITNEVKEVSRLTNVKQEIEGALEKQRVFLQKTAPILKAIKLPEKKKARRTPFTKPFRESLKKGILEIPEESKKEIAIPVSEEKSPPPLSLFKEFEMKEVLPLLDTEPELTDTEALMEDHLTLQQLMLDELEQTLTIALNQGETKVEVELDGELSSSLVAQEEPLDKLLTEALTIHFTETQKVLEQEIVVLDQTLIAQTEPVIKEALPEAPEVPKQEVKEAEKADLQQEIEKEPSIPEPVSEKKDEGIAKEMSQEQETKEEKIVLGEELEKVKPLLAEDVPQQPEEFLADLKKNDVTLLGEKVFEEPRTPKNLELKIPVFEPSTVSEITADGSAVLSVEKKEEKKSDEKKLDECQKKSEDICGDNTECREKEEKRCREEKEQKEKGKKDLEMKQRALEFKKEALQDVQEKLERIEKRKD